MAEHNIIGKWGEALAVDYLVGKGYAILERNWRLGHLEIDIVAMKDDRVAFVEVKTRVNPDDDPIEAVDRRKMMHMIRAANAYFSATKLPHDPQFDIIGISGTPDDYTLEHIPDAFLPPLKSY